MKSKQSMIPIRLVLLLVAPLILADCAARTVPLTGMSADQLMERGNAALQNRKWTDAIEAFEQFSLQYPTHARGQEARYRLGEAYFGKREYITAATEFARLASDFPAGPWADDSRFKVCESYYNLSPKTALDQQYTVAARDHCQSLEIYYPTSEYVERARTILTEMVNKLADKEYRNAEFYFKRGAYDSAIIYYEAVLAQYPTANAAPQSLFRLFQTYTNLGYKEEADAAKARLLKDYPSSAAARSVQDTVTVKPS
jgi:outer membrane protein assembly factor BamD